MSHGLRPGPTNSLVDVSGLRIGHALRVGDGWRNGVTVVLAPLDGAVGGVAVRVGAPGTRETDLLDPRDLVERVHAVVLSGGSAYGLAAATGVAELLGDAGIGFPVGSAPGEVVPIVPAAVLFDLGRGGRFRATPDAAMGAAAGQAALAGESLRWGTVGAGTGAVAGGFAGGVGSASAVLSDGTTVAALVAVNAAGSPVDPATGELLGTRLGLPGEFSHVGTPAAAEVAAWRPPATVRSFNTCLGVVATDAALTKAWCCRLASIAHDGLARAVRPAHLMVDGDTMFALATGERPTPDIAAFNELLAVGADCVSRAVAHALLAAEGWPETPSYRQVFPSAVRSF